MLTIRAAQTEAFRSAAREQFVTEVARHLRHVAPQRVDGLSADRVQERIHDGLDRAAQFGFTVGWDICRFIELRFRWGDDFADRNDMEWAGTICRDPHLAPAAKLNLLEYELRYGRGQEVTA